MKLINAEKFEAGIVLMEMSFLRSGDGKDTEYKRGAITAMQSIKELLKKVPVDYDVDAIVEQLEKEKNRIYREDGSLMGERTAIRIDKAIEIVKGGGV